MRCIFCKSPSANSRSEEHVLPESLGNVDHVLPAGVVCDDCNNYFSLKIEGPVLNSGYFKSLRFAQAVPNKKQRYPIQKGLITPGVVCDIHSDPRHGFAIDIPPEYAALVARQERGQLIFPTTGAEPGQPLMSRFIGKVAIEAMALRLLQKGLDPHTITDEPALECIRNWVRWGKSLIPWPFNQRMIYEADTSHRTAACPEAHQIMHEWDFLSTASGEFYFCLAIFGVEYAINTAGPSIDGYADWIRDNPGKSPLDEK
jgi:hypothetical protein